MSTSNDMRALADRISAAADTITALNVSNGHGRDLAWKSRDLHSHAFALRIEADEYDNDDDEPWDDTQCDHCGIWDGQPHDRMCRIRSRRMKTFWVRRKSAPAATYPPIDDPYLPSPKMDTGEEIAIAMEAVVGYLGLSRHRGYRISPQEYSFARHILSTAQKSLVQQERGK